MIARATLHAEPGGDTIQILYTAKYLRELGIEVDVKLTPEIGSYASYDLLHFFNITRPADILVHIRLSKKPFVITPIFIEYGEFDKHFRKGIPGRIFKMLNPHAIEYLKIIGRRIYNGERIMSREYLLSGQKKSIQRVLSKASFLLPNSYSEMKRLGRHFDLTSSFAVIPNGIDETIFQRSEGYQKDELLVLCVARIEGIKNQLNLIKALNGSRFKLLLIGKPAQNQLDYWKACREIAADNVHFMGNMPQEALVQFYKQAKVHILPSWFETTGLSSLEAAAMKCNIVITDKGDAKDYFGPDAWYCDPASPESIYEAVEKAAAGTFNEALCKRVFEQYTWKMAATKTLEIYKNLKKNITSENRNFRNKGDSESLRRI